MIKCPRCEFMIDETKMAACPVCYTPVAPQETAPQPGMPAVAPIAPPAANAAPGIPGIPTPAALGGAPGAPMQPSASAIPPPGGNANVRYNLMGEVIEENPVAQPNRFSGNAAPAMQKAGAGIAAQRAKDDAAAKQATMFRVFVGFAIFCCIGGGIFWYLKLRTNPKEQLQHYIEATKNGELTSVYNLTDLSTDLQEQFPNAKKFDEKTGEMLKGAPGGAYVFKQTLAVGFNKAKLGEVKYEGGEAVIPVSVFGFKKDVHLKNVWGIWKVVDDGDGVIGYVGKMEKGGAAAFQNGGNGGITGFGVGVGGGVVNPSVGP